MKYDPKREEYVFDTGKTFHANCGTIGIDNDLVISEGYDGGLDEDLTDGEKIELANYMIDLWLKFMRNGNGNDVT